MKYDNAKVNANIRAICKINGQELGQIEKSIGKYPGYFSKQRKLSAEMLFEVADAIGIDPMELITSDFSDTLAKAKAKEELMGLLKKLAKYMTQDEMVKMTIVMIGDIFHTSIY